ncbi:2-keto-4-pentenoate hydratase [Mycobacteroides abscessus]|uniref:2-keto-4-pentenoate hydratase n=1 Tax=Mycobacteroides abscessus TaxID=36809 RepID=UPI000926174B|nr:fumarylacetoacetate hydrolase family protein [Mycobacteroides abscessus]MDO2972282.1 fumarylacetoacetate hydrolase family protein [Mycobacteroides abscessus subsp. bolletii]MDO3071155.1 fumarylacetoacetate hydrolase family protein [Mycobacteroides abscessus subsp. bolletii]MDO3076492.1 fumarylacetoacetate hydrolase family protein [Mycobacteroides abscessus subsp. bolletii]SHZ92108.1 TodF product hydratase [Mycobacteroides abscessus subsp. bolletii]SIA22140.1 TodF product hydratase [Mycobact
MIAGADICTAAERLEFAAVTGIPCAPVRDIIGADDIDTAYLVQRSVIDRRVARGASVAGHKIGLTSEAVQRQLGVHQPDFGVLLSDMDVSALQYVPSDRLLQPKIEAEIAFRLGEDLDNGDLGPSQVRAAVDAICAALEIVDSRIANWDITIADTVADNGSSGLYVLNGHWTGLDACEPREVTMRMYTGDLRVCEGTGTACLGDPLIALAWLARTTRKLGRPLRAGQIVLSGALGPMIAPIPNTTIRAELSGLGTVTARFPPQSQGNDDDASV